MQWVNATPVAVAVKRVDGTLLELPSWAGSGAFMCNYTEPGCKHAVDGVPYTCPGDYGIGDELSLPDDLPRDENGELAVRVNLIVTILFADTLHSDTPDKLIPRDDIDSLFGEKDGKHVFIYMLDSGPEVVGPPARGMHREGGKNIYSHRLILRSALMEGVEHGEA